MNDIVKRGTNPGDGTGDDLWTAAGKINNRFAQLVSILSGQGAWAPTRYYEAYPARHWVVKDGVGYVAAKNHNSGLDFAADLALGNWLALDVLQMYLDYAGLTGAGLIGTLDGHTVQDWIDKAVLVVEEKVATAGQTVVNLTKINYVPGSGLLRFYLNGLLQDDGAAYTETSPTSITTSEPLADGDALKFIINEFSNGTSATQLRMELGNSAIGASLMMANGSDITGAPVEGLHLWIRRSEINVAQMFGLSPGDDITAAMRLVLADGRGWYLKGTPAGAANDWLISDDLPLQKYDQVGRGDGMTVTRIRSTVADKHMFTRGALPANRLRIRDMWLTTLGIGSPLYFPYAAAEAGIMYASEFRGLRLTAADANALHLGLEFQTAIRDTWAESNTMHSFFVQGGNTTIFDNTYALKCGPDKAGYRSLGGGQFNSANGINVGGSNWWLGGTATDAADPNPVTAIFQATMVNCNAEFFRRFGLKLRQEGTCTWIGGKFASNAAGYLAFADLNGTCHLHLLGNPRLDIAGSRVAEVSEGVATPYAADWNVNNSSSQIVLMDGSMATAPQYCQAGANPKPMWSQESQNKVVTLGIAGASVAGVNTVASACRYKLDGDSCRVWGRLTLTTKDAAMAGNVRLTGLPFTSNASLTLCGSGGVSRSDLVTLTGGRTQLGVEVTASTTYMQLFQFGSGVAAAAVSAAELVSGSIIDFDITYLL